MIYKWYIIIFFISVIGCKMSLKQNVIITPHLNSKYVDWINRDDSLLFRTYFNQLKSSLLHDSIPIFLLDSSFTCTNKYSFLRIPDYPRSLRKDIIDSLPNKLFFKLRYHKDSNEMKNKGNCPYSDHGNLSTWQLIIRKHKRIQMDSDILNSDICLKYPSKKSLKNLGAYISRDPDTLLAKYYPTFNILDSNKAIFITANEQEIGDSFINVENALMFNYRLIGRRIIFQRISIKPMTSTLISYYGVVKGKSIILRKREDKSSLTLSTKSKDIDIKLYLKKEIISIIVGDSY